MNRNLSTKTVLAVLLPVLAVFVLLVLNKTTVQDWWHATRYTPETQIQLLADKADFNDEGERLFFRASPELISPARIEALCSGADHLGCLVTGPKIYLLEYEKTGQPEYYQSVVTGAHEMLHMAYFRLDQSAKAELKPLIDKALKDRVKDTRIFNVLDKTTGDEEYYDEAHSLLGTEVDFLPLALEAHYLNYFDDREDVLEAFDKSKGLLDG